jgi:phenylalanyl-tRNA synthetase beta chain
VFEIGTVARVRPHPMVAPILAIDRRPTAEELARLEAALPDQPRMISIVLTGEREASGWWGHGRQADFHDAIEAAHAVLRSSRVQYSVRAGQREPWHPGRCAEFLLEPAPGSDGRAAGEPVSLGYAGELHPRVIADYRLAPRTCATELDLSLIEQAAAILPPVQAPVVSTYPVASQDVALVVDAAVPAADVESALAAGAAAAGTGAELEQVRLFDVYTGEQAGPGRKSLAYTLRFRAPDRTLTDDDVAVARDAAVAEAARLTGAVLRGQAPAGA